MRRWLGGSVRNSGNISRGTTSKAFTAARNKGLNVNLEVDGNPIEAGAARRTDLPGIG
jgi:hypothetical protein